MPLPITASDGHAITDGSGDPLTGELLNCKFAIYEGRLAADLFNH